jgi:hypothetical protein
MLGFAGYSGQTGAVMTALKCAVPWRVPTMANHKSKSYLVHIAEIKL